MTPDGGSMSIPQILWIEVSRDLAILRSCGSGIHQMRHSYPGSLDPGIESGGTHPTDESPCALRHSSPGTLPRLLIYDGARRVNGCLAGTHPTDESSCATALSLWDTPQAPAGARRVNGCLAGTPRPTGSESHRSWQPILWMSHHTRTPCIQGLGPRIRGPGQSLETEVSRFGTPRG